MGQRLLLLSASVGSGHNMAAAVLESNLKGLPGVDVVKKIDVLESTSELYRTLYDDAYFSLVEAVPWLVGWGYDAGDPPFRLGNSITVWDRINTTSTVKAIKRFRPDIVICTHFLPTRLASLMITRGTLKAKLVAVTTDYDFQGLWLSSPFNHFFVAREETKEFMADIGVPADRLTVSGIPVRSVFGDPVGRNEVLERYRLKDSVPILLISAGAAGGAYTRSIVQQTLRMRNDFQAVVVCGHNKALKSRIEGLVSARTGQYRVLGYTTDMPDLMRVATVFVGKPGGLSASECMAAGLPMILIKPIPGQEERNSDFLLEEGAAVRCNYETTVGYKIDHLLENPSVIERMAENARRLGRPDAAAKVATTILSEQPPPLWISHAAQKSILAAAEQGVATRDLDAPRRILTLVDVDTALSVGVITSAQLSAFGAARGGSVPARDELTISARQLSKMRRHRGDPNLLHTLRRIVGGSAKKTLQIRG